MLRSDDFYLKQTVGSETTRRKGNRPSLTEEGEENGGRRKRNKRRNKNKECIRSQATLLQPSSFPYPKLNLGKWDHRFETNIFNVSLVNAKTYYS